MDHGHYYNYYPDVTTIGPAVSVGNVAVVNVPDKERFQPFQSEFDYNFRKLAVSHQKEVLRMIHGRLERVTDLPDGRSLFFMKPGLKAEEVMKELADNQGNVTDYPYLHLEIDDTLFEVLETAVHQHGHGGLFAVLYDSLLRAFPAGLVMRIMQEQRLEWPEQTEGLVMPELVVPENFQVNGGAFAVEGE